MKKFTFVRHAEKKYNNNKGPPGFYQHDPDIYPFDKNKSIKIYQENKFDLIISSPFKRTRKTSQQILNDLDLKDVKIIIDNDISEYLGFQKPKYEKASIEPETMKYIQPLLGVENFFDLKKRLINFYNNLCKKEEDNILIVTHGINIEFLYQIIFEKKLKNRPNILEGFVFNF